MNVPYRLNVMREFGSIYLANVLDVNSVVNAHPDIIEEMARSRSCGKLNR
jgi:hypothetical protein